MNFLKYKSLGVSIFLINKYFINFPIAYSFSLINTENELIVKIDSYSKFIHTNSYLDNLIEKSKTNIDNLNNLNEKTLAETINLNKLLSEKENYIKFNTINKDNSINETLKSKENIYEKRDKLSQVIKNLVGLNQKIMEVDNKRIDLNIKKEELKISQDSVMELRNLYEKAFGQPK